LNWRQEVVHKHIYIATDVGENNLSMPSVWEVTISLRQSHSSSHVGLSVPVRNCRLCDL